MPPGRSGLEYKKKNPQGLLVVPTSSGAGRQCRYIKKQLWGIHGKVGKSHKKEIRTEKESNTAEREKAFARL